MSSACINYPVYKWHTIWNGDIVDIRKSYLWYSKRRRRCSLMYKLHDLVVLLLQKNVRGLRVLIERKRVFNRSRIDGTVNRSFWSFVVITWWITMLYEASLHNVVCSSIVGANSIWIKTKLTSHKTKIKPSLLLIKLEL